MKYGLSHTKKALKDMFGGIVTAKKLKEPGRSKTLSEAKKLAIYVLRESKEDDKELAKNFGVSASTVPNIYSRAEKEFAQYGGFHDNAERLENILKLEQE